MYDHYILNKDGVYELVMLNSIIMHVFIMLTCPCNVDPHTPHSYILNFGVYGGIHYFLKLALKHRL